MLPTEPRPARRPSLQGDDRAAADFVGNMLLVVLVVLLGSVVAIVVTSAVSQEGVPPASFALAPVAPGDDEARVLLRNGDPIPLDGVRLRLERNGTAEDVPASTWTAPAGRTLRAGEAIAFPLSPAAAHGESLRVRVVRADVNAIVADLATVAGASDARLPAPTLAAALSRAALPNDSASVALVTARVSHPLGALGAARVAADLSNLTGGATPLAAEMNDEGRDGDDTGGDGVWSGLLRVPTLTPAGWYNLTVNVTDASGRVAASQRLPLEVTRAPGSGGGTGDGSGGGSVTGGTCYGCVVVGGSRSYEGTRLQVPNSTNITRLVLTNWTVDRLHPARLDNDFVLFRIVSADKGWSCYLELEEHDGKPYTTYMRVWHDGAESEYVPRNTTGNAPRLSLDNLTMDLLAPVDSLQWVPKSTSPNPHPAALYQNAKITGAPTLIVTYIGQDETTSNKQRSLETGIYSFDLAVGG